jgi:hypothetical protein
MVRMPMPPMPPMPEACSRPLGRPRGLFVSAVAALLLLVLAPYLPAGWRALKALDRVGVDTRWPSGVVRVESCQRAALPWAWTCTGTFEASDPAAQPYPPTPGVALRDDARFHAHGNEVGVAIARGSDDAYRWGRVAQGRTVFLWAGVALTVAAAALGIAFRFRGTLAAAALMAGIAMLVVARPL